MDEALCLGLPRSLVRPCLSMSWEQGSQSRTQIIWLEMPNWKHQRVLPLNTLSCAAGQEPAAPKTTPHNNIPGDGERHCSSLAQLAGSGQPPGRGAVGLAGENKGISGVKRLRLKACASLTRSRRLLCAHAELGWEVRAAGYCPVVSVPCLPPLWLGHSSAQSMPRVA